MVAVLTDHGLDVAWDRDPNQRIEVHLADWRKPRHGALAEFPEPDESSAVPQAPSTY